MENYHWRILLIDDDEDDFFLVSEMLAAARQGKFLLEWAATYADGLDAVQRNHFDAVLVDYELGQKTGIDLIRETTASGYQAPIILLTGQGSYEIDLNAMQAGAADYIDKNELNPGYLERSLRYAIERKRGEIEREQLLEENRRQSELLRILFDRIPVMLTLYRPDLQSFQFNRTFEKTLGWTEQDAAQLGAEMMEKFYPDPEYRREVAAFMASLAGGWRDFRVTAKDGSLVDSSWSNVWLTDDTQVGIGIDLRERIAAEQALLKSRADLQFTAEAGQVGLWDWDVENKELTCDSRCRNLFGVTAETPIDEGLFFESLDADERRDIIARLAAFAEQGETFELEFRIYPKNETPRWVNVRGRSSLNAAGAPARISGAVIDVTARKQLEQDMAVALEQAVNEKNRLLAVMEALPMGAAITDAKGGVLLTNRAYENVWGDPIPSAQSVSDYEVFKAWRADTGERLLPEEWASACAVQYGETVLGQNLRIQRFDGEMAYVVNSAAPIYDADGSIIGSAVAILDITEHKRREQDAYFLATLGNRLLSLQTPEDVFRVVSRETGEYLQADFCFLVEEDSQEQTLTICNGYQAGGEPLKSRWQLEEIPAFIVEALTTGQKLVVEDVSLRPDTESSLSLFGAQTSSAAFMLLPRHVAGELAGGFYVGDKKPRRWLLSESELLQSVANLAWLAVENTRTQHKQKVAEELFRVALQNSPIVVFKQDINLAYTWIHNPRHNLSIEQVLGKTDADLLGSEAAALLTETKQTALQSGQNIRREMRYEINGEEVVYDLWIEPLRSRTGEIAGLTGAVMDITELRRLESAHIEQAARMEVQRRLIQQREQERLDLARDLHDGPLQEVTAISYGLSEAIDIDDKATRLEKLIWVQQTLRGLAHDIRSFCNELRPPALAPFGLEKAIRSHINEFCNRYQHLRVHLDLVQDEQALDENMRMALFRIYQEALMNVAKHAQAQEIWVVFKLDEQAVTLEIRDDGVGFEVPHDWVTQARSGHFGLIGMFERAEAIDAQIEVESQPGQGARVRVFINLPSSDR